MLRVCNGSSPSATAGASSSTNGAPKASAAAVIVVHIVLFVRIWGGVTAEAAGVGGDGARELPAAAAGRDNAKLVANALPLVLVLARGGAPRGAREQLPEGVGL